MAKKTAQQVLAARAVRPGEDKLKIKVFSPYQIYYEGPANSISAVNKAGPFDVLFNHANFFSLLLPGNIIIDTGYQKYSFPISRGIIKVSHNVVTVFVDV